MGNFWPSFPHHYLGIGSVTAGDTQIRESLRKAPSPTCGWRRASKAWKGGMFNLDLQEWEGALWGRSGKEQQFVRGTETQAPRVTWFGWNEMPGVVWQVMIGCGGTFCPVQLGGWT